jgi:enoyl-CoA hydratase/carnithine racemase
VRDALPKKVLFDLIYRARLLSAAEARELDLLNDLRPRAAVLEYATELAEHAASYRADVVALGRDLYYRMRGLPADDALSDAGRTLLAALAASDKR